MSIPGFTATASIGPASQTYGGRWSAPGAALVVPSQRWFPTIRCCGRVCIGSWCRFMCRTCRVHPGKQCSCIPNFPACVCRDLEAFPG